ncbi:MAG: hypothetical protein PVSMB9_07290 [Candidatus Dormibacteria bacterium]
MRRMLRALAAGGVTAAILAASATEGHTADGASLSVDIVAQSGYQGHAFVYAQVHDSSTAYPAPTGSGHQSRFYAQWVRQPLGSPSCPWIWAVYVFDRLTGAQVNVPPPSAPQQNFGTTTSLCASPSATPVEQPPMADAAARLDLDLQVALSPSHTVAGTPSMLTARLSGAIVQDLNLYLNMAIEDWSVSRWSVDFGDGSGATLAGQPSNQLALAHTYYSAGTYDARVVARIQGDAQAARYDGYGNVHLLREPFEVEVGNDTAATTGAAPVRTYVGPAGFVAVSPALDGTAPGAGSFRRVEALRGDLTDFFIHLVITREGQIRLGAALAGTASTRLLRWRYDGAASDAPPSAGARTGQIGDPGNPVRLQWNQPDRLSGKQPEDYQVPITLFVQTRFSDGHSIIYAIRSTFSVTIEFAAQSG